MKKYSAIIFALSFIVLLSSCNSKNNRNSQQGMLYTSGGRTSEVLVVMADQNWEKSAGDTIRNSLGEVPPWMAQNEPEYRVAQIAKHQFGAVFQKFRNILIVEFKPSLSKPKVSVKHNVWARPQTIIKIQSPNLASFLKTYTEVYPQIKAYFHKNELARIKDAYKKMKVRKISNKLVEKFSFDMVFPKGYIIATDGADFLWLRRPTTEVEEGILIYTFPYTDTSVFNMHKIIQARNLITKKFIPGPVDGSYMKVSSIFPAVANTMEFKGNYATELRSLWDVHGYAMGGPFMSYTFVDTIAHRVVVLDGYIKAPRKKKRDLMLHIEAVFDTFKFVNKAEKKLEN